MEIGEILRYVLMTVGALALIALVVVFIELARTLKAARTTVVDLKKQLDPTLENVNAITEGLKPTLEKVDPVMDRVQLTLDAANLEIMRLDTIMSDLGDISGSLNSAVGAIDTMANAPINLVNKASAKVEGLLGGSKAASPESAALGAGRKTAAPALKEPDPEAEPAPTPEEKIAKVAKVARTAKAGYVTVAAKLKKDKDTEAETEEPAPEPTETDSAAANLTEAVLTVINDDAEATLEAAAEAAFAAAEDAVEEAAAKAMEAAAE